MKTLFLSVSGLFICALLSAQTTIKPGIGLNFTDFSKTPATSEFKAKVGYQVGGSIAFGKKFYFEPGLFYVGKSTEFSTVSTSNPIKENFNFSGFRIPVAVGLNLIGDEKSTISLRGFGGLSGFFVTKVSDEVDKDAIKKSSYGLFAGAGLDFWKLYLDASYEWSLTNVQKDVSSIDIGKSRSLFITAGLRINL